MSEKDRVAFYGLIEVINDLTIMPSEKDLDRMKEILFVNLSQYPFDVVSKALYAHCREEKFFPMLADIVRQIEGTLEERAAMAWALVMKAKQKYKLRKAIRFPDPAIHFAIEKMGGWERVYWLVDDANESFRAAEFQRFFRIGEKIASWNGEGGKIKVCPYFPSEEEIYAQKKGKKFKREIFDVENDIVINIGDNIKQLYA